MAVTTGFRNDHRILRAKLALEEARECFPW